MWSWTQILNPHIPVIINKCAQCKYCTIIPTNILCFVLLFRNSLMDMNDQCVDTIIQTFDIR